MSGQNRSTAVMQRRHVAPDSLDYFPTPPWATRALLELLAQELGDLSTRTAWDPCCGEGHMVRPLLEAFGSVRASDVHPYSRDHEVADFLFEVRTAPRLDVIMMNPPFRLAAEFIDAALGSAREAVAVLVRTAFLESEGRFDTLWLANPPDFVLQFAERVVMLKDRLVQAGTVDPFADKPGTTARSATAYCWMVWIKGRGGDTRLRWIGPCRQRLEREGDYPDYGLEVEAAATPLFERSDAA